MATTKCTAKLTILNARMLLEMTAIVDANVVVQRHAKLKPGGMEPDAINGFSDAMKDMLIMGRRCGQTAA